MPRIVIPLIFGLLGTAVLLSLGLWQLQRLEWKEAILAEIEAQIGAAPVPLPEVADPDRLRYLPVTVAGKTTGRALFALVSTKERGAGYRVISGFETDEGRRIMVDEGFVPVQGTDTRAALAPGGLRVTGNLHWPEEVDGFTPEPDLDANLIFARDVPLMADALGTEPILVVARKIEGEPTLGAAPLPVTTTGIPNNHLGYAVQWFGLAAVWLGMTAFLIWRIHRRTV